MENAIDFGIVFKYSTVEILHFFQDGNGNQQYELSLMHFAWVWLPSHICFSRSVKLRCAAVQNLKEKLHYWVAWVSQCQLLLRGECTHQLPYDGITIAKKRKEKLHEDYALVRDTRMKYKEFKDITEEFDAVPKKKKRKVQKVGGKKEKKRKKERKHKVKSVYYLLFNNFLLPSL